MIGSRKALVTTLALLTAFLTLINAQYDLTPEEIQAFIGLKKSIDPDYKPFVSRNGSTLSNSSFGMIEAGDRRGTRHNMWPKNHDPQNTYRRQISSVMDCVTHDGSNRNRFFFHYRWVESVCDNPGRDAYYKVTCNTTFTISRPNYRGRIFHLNNMVFRHYCLGDLVCMPYGFLRLNPAWAHLEARDIHCVNRASIIVIGHKAIAQNTGESSGVKRKRNEFCSPDVFVPGTAYPSTWQQTSFVLTEEVSWANGSYYNAPKLYIRDSPKYSHFGFDRALKTNSDLVSAEITVGSVRGQLHSLPVNFCVEMLTGGNVWTIMMYTWFQINARRSRPPITNHAIEYADPSKLDD